MSVIRGKIVATKGRSAPRVATNSRVTAAVVKRIRDVNTQDWIYVSPKENTWTVRKDGAQRVMRVYKQKNSALNAAKRIMNIANNGQIIVYNSSGEISKVIE